MILVVLDAYHSGDGTCFRQADDDVVRGVVGIFEAIVDEIEN